ncbi:adenosylcobinamide-GDP ribazoletransferase [Thermogymnomonas acidicola]|uniref:adenosylcobinamide-GDP ribazoletransferase n=1 Tax=Thermogymnomonas acidicola TaxID=399579 RepID=UPI0009464721|nr:adenosylcobinamide-GDP ribazoletransferase [Thermogymnomonas acidicola]
MTFVILYGALLSAFSSTPFPFFAFLLAEMASKSSMVLSALHGRPFGRGMGQSFRESLDRRRAPPSVLANTLPQLVLALLFPGPGAYSLLVAVASSIAASLFLHRAFGGFNGDVLGLTGEIGRISFAVSFLILARLHMYPDLCLLHSLLASSRS